MFAKIINFLKLCLPNNLSLAIKLISLFVFFLKHLDCHLTFQELIDEASAHQREFIYF